ncbi:MULTISPECIES: phosphatidylethanolamine-binding protein [unclassified Micromonospora]|uniref:phosphatidylethanolamine-binding protein n=1 Tax=unclassified Micromonospora TaxID=2617518 RepID=UPI00104812A1|nr:MULTISPECIES: phosphatidylethanolamine-binding protein [unclassified Micromonospora]TDB81167.1 phosphatidylethanolamine-binding protein [Micromonospora sp. KC721]TDC32783.1 phosphatidylethanolamine-binding protein [Micromonospora sp. KC213]
MPGPRPGSNAYDKERARLRDLIEQSGRAADQEANQVANRILQEDRGQRGMARGDRTFGPKGEREPGDPK